MGKDKSLTQISITVDKNVLASVDSRAEKENRTRSNMIGKMLKEHLGCLNPEVEN